MMPMPLPVNNNWLEWAMSYVEGTTNPDSQSLADYIKMHETDDVIFSSSEYLKRSVIKKLGDYVHLDKQEIQDFIRKIIKGMRGNFLRSASAMLTSVDFGFSVTEIVHCELPGGSIGFCDLQTLWPKSITFDIHRSGPLKNRLKWIKQWWRMGKQWEADIPINKAIVMTHGESFGNVYGVSRYKRAWPLWKMKQVLLKAYVITLERYGCPLSIARTGDPNGKVNINGRIITTSKYLTEVMDSLSVKGSLVVPMGTEIEILKHQGGPLGADFLEALQWINQQMQLALGLPSLITGSGKVGSHSLGVQHAENFADIQDQIGEELQESILEQLVLPLVEWEFGPQDDYGMFLNEEFDPEKAAALAKVAKDLSDAGVVDMDKLEDVNFFREEIGLDPWTQEDLQSLIDRHQSFPEMPMVQGNADAPGQTKTKNPDENAFSYAGRRRNRARARRELYARLSRSLTAEAA